jgi:ABC-type multidrug transport system fused ATPase/permease subunit
MTAAYYAFGLIAALLSGFVLCVLGNARIVVVWLTLHILVRQPCSAQASQSYSVRTALSNRERSWPRLTSSHPGLRPETGQAISNFTELNPGRLKSKSDRTSLWIFVVAIVSAVVEGGQNWLFSRTADSLEAKVRTLSFQAMLRSDVAWFDAPQHTVRKAHRGASAAGSKS